MRERPAGLGDNQLIRGLADGWGLQARELTLRPLGWRSLLGAGAPAERDLRMSTGRIGATGDDPALLERYQQRTGRAVSPELIAFYRPWWVLADVAIYVDELRRPHGENADLAASLTRLIGNLRE